MELVIVSGALLYRTITIPEPPNPPVFGYLSREPPPPPPPKPFVPFPPCPETVLNAIKGVLEPRPPPPKG